jgi:myotubularin-related protein 1/2
MRQSILKAFGLSASEPVQFDFDDNSSGSTSGGQTTTDNIPSFTPLSSNITVIPSPTPNITINTETNETKTDDEAMLTNSTNTRAPGNTFRERARASANLALTSQDFFSSAMNNSQMVNKMMSTYDIALYAGEQIHLRDQWVYEWNGYNGANCQWHQGCLILTNYRIIFKPSSISTYDDIPVFQGSQVPLTTIHRIEKIGGKLSKQDHGYLIEMYTKDLRHLKFSFLPSQGTRGNIYKFISEEKFDFFCFQYKLPINNTMVDGWHVYDPTREFTRQGVLQDPSQPSITPPRWRLCNVNNDFKMCDTYAAQFLVPADISDEEIRAVAAFRSKGRLPVLSWYCKETGASLTRSAQPLIGFNITGARNKKFKDDYRMIEAILQAHPKAVRRSTPENPGNMSARSFTPSNSTPTSSNNTSPSNTVLDANGTPIMSTNAPSNGEKLMIVDLRPRANAEANRVIRGAGYEKNYKDCELQFLNIANIHVMRASFSKLMELCMNFGGMDAKWHEKVEGTSWLEYLRTILVAAQFCVTTMERDKCSVLCHCSDGWDRTAQVVSLAQMLIDPYFRTMEGFAVLVEKEWLSYGHQFHKRCGHGSRGSFFMDERGPIFVQYVDCVYQLIRQHPTAFEFNEAFLIFVLDELYSCRFGTFLYDSERERVENKLSSRSPSLWTYLLNPGIMLGEPPELQPQYQGRSYGRHDLSSHTTKNSIQNQFFNPFYDPDQTNYTIFPDLRHSSIRLWTGYWLRFGKDPLGYEYHFPDPSHTIHRKAMDYLSDMNVMQDFKLRIETKNEATVQTFQKEFRNMYQEIDQLKSKCDEWRLRWEADTGALLSLCEKQREELQRWSGSILPNTEQSDILERFKKNDEQQQQQQQQQQETKSVDIALNDSKDTSIDDIELLRKECEAWKQKCLELQVDILQKKRARTLRRENGHESTNDKELEKLKSYVLQLQGTIMQQRQQLQQQQNMKNNEGKGAHRTDSSDWDSIDHTWRTVSGVNDNSN